MKKEIQIGDLVKLRRDVRDPRIGLVVLGPTATRYFYRIRWIASHVTFLYSESELTKINP